MPRGGQRRLVTMPSLQPLLAPPTRQQRCVVCYKSFTPFEFNSENWDSKMIKNFYSSMNIGSSLGSSGDEDDEVLSLPFCPQCHTKVSVMNAYQIELQNIKSKCNSIRNDLAFQVVETISQNSRDGPIGYIRQQIYEKWHLTYADQQGKLNEDEKIGLEYIAGDPRSTPHNCGNFVCFCHISDTQDGNQFVENGRENGYEHMDLSKANVSGTGITVERPPMLSSNKSMHQSFRGKLSGKAFGNIQRKRGTGMKAQTHRRHNFGSGRNYLSGIKRQSNFKAKVGGHFVTGARNSSQSKDLIQNITNQEIASIEDVVHVDSNVEDGGTDFGSSRSKRKLSADFEIEDGGTKPKSAKSETPVFEGSAEEGSTRQRARGYSSSSNLPETFVYKCKMCTKAYEAKSQLLRHESTIHPELRAYHCDYFSCGVGFSSKEAYKRHMVNTHKLNPATFNCCNCAFPKCPRKFFNERTMELHVQDVHHKKMIELEGMLLDSQHKSEMELNEAGDLVIAEDGVSFNNAEIQQAIIAEDENALESIELLESQPKAKKKGVRPFGIRKRKRGGSSSGKKKKILTSDTAGTEESENVVKKTRRRIPKTEVAVEPIRKSSRQRGVQLDVGKPMYPALEPKLKVEQMDEDNQEGQEMEKDTEPPPVMEEQNTETEDNIPKSIALDDSSVPEKEMADVVTEKNDVEVSAKDTEVAAEETDVLNATYVVDADADAGSEEA